MNKVGSRALALIVPSLLYAEINRATFMQQGFFTMPISNRMEQNLMAQFGAN